MFHSRNNGVRGYPSVVRKRRPVSGNLSTVGVDEKTDLVRLDTIQQVTISDLH